MTAHVRLWLDDHVPAPEGWTTVTNLDAARSLIEAGVDEISIGDRLDREHGRSLDLVLWLVASGHWPKRRPTVHGDHALRSAIMKGAVAIAWPLRDRIPADMRERLLDARNLASRIPDVRELALKATRWVPARFVPARFADRHAGA